MIEHGIEVLKVIFLGIVEGITEWLPISSTGHMLLVDEFLQMNVSEAFKDMFFVVIQLGAILAVVILFWEKMWPFQRKTPTQPAVRWDTIQMWCKVVVACIPGAVVTILFDDYIEAHLHTPTVIAAALILYGVGFILIENWNKTRTPKVQTLAEITYRTACFRFCPSFRALPVRDRPSLAHFLSGFPGWRRRNLPSFWLYR